MQHPPIAGPVGSRPLLLWVFGPDFFAGGVYEGICAFPFGHRSGAIGSVSRVISWVWSFLESFHGSGSSGRWQNLSGRYPLA